ncbi:vasotab-like [Hetaerina americana]|uniref:vasotab-like n=1 Tax=Hetaerina americana TaxID=62018 RepID=UPI003A7F19C6
MGSSRMALLAAVVCVLAVGLRKASAAAVPCPNACTLEYAPVCGQRANGSTREFANACALRVYRCNNPGVIVSSRRGRCS